MRNVILVVIGAMLMYFVLRVLSGKKVDSSQTAKAFKNLARTQQAASLVRTNEFRELVKTSAFRNLVATLAEQELQTLSETLLATSITK